MAYDKYSMKGRYGKEYKMGGSKQKYGYKQGEMRAHVEDFAKPEKCYSQKYDQAPLNYVERNDRLQGHEASKLRGEAHYGRYDKG